MEFLHNKCWTSYSFVATDIVQYQLGNRSVPSYWQKALFYCFGNKKVANGIVVIIVALLIYPSWGKFCLSCWPKPWISRRPQQAGFAPSHSMMEQIFTVRQLFEKFKNSSTPFTLYLWISRTCLTLLAGRCFG